MQPRGEKERGYVALPATRIGSAGGRDLCDGREQRAARVTPAESCRRGYAADRSEDSVSMGHSVAREVSVQRPRNDQAGVHPDSPGGHRPVGHDRRYPTGEAADENRCSTPSLAAGSRMIWTGPRHLPTLGIEARCALGGLRLDDDDDAAGSARAAPRREPRSLSTSMRSGTQMSSEDTAERRRTALVAQPGSG